LSDTFTPREVYAIAEHRARAMWDHTSMIAATVMNCMASFGGSKNIIDPAVLNPYRPESIKDMSQVAGDRGMSVKQFIDRARGLVK